MEQNKRWAVNQTPENSKMLYAFAGKSGKKAPYWHHEGGSLGTYYCEGAVGAVTSAHFWETHYKIDYEKWLEIPEVKEALHFNILMTDELKERFFAQYLYQNVLKQDGKPNIGFNVFHTLANHNHIDRDSLYLELRHVSSLTKEEVKHLILIEGEDVDPTEDDISFVVSVFSDVEDFTADQTKFSTSVDIVDYLRSIGIALPFMGVPVQKQLEAGWIKFKA